MDVIKQDIDIKKDVNDKQTAILESVVAEWFQDSDTGKVTAGKLVISAGEISLREFIMLFYRGYFQSGQVEIKNAADELIAHYQIIDDNMPQVIWFYINNITLEQSSLLANCTQIAYKSDDRRKGAYEDVCCAIDTAAILFLASLRGDEIIVKE